MALKGPGLDHGVGSAPRPEPTLLTRLLLNILIFMYKTRCVQFYYCMAKQGIWAWSISKLDFNLIINGEHKMVHTLISRVGLFCNRVIGAAFTALSICRIFIVTHKKQRGITPCSLPRFLSSLLKREWRSLCSLLLQLIS